MAPRPEDGASLRLRHKEPAKKGGVMILCYPVEGEVHFPLIQRPAYDGVHGGQISLPGGKWEEGDEDLRYTALREMEEEIGVNSEAVEVLGYLTEFPVHASNHEVLPVVGWLDERPIFYPDEIEVADVIEASVPVITQPAAVKQQQIMTTRGDRLIAPYYDVKGNVVWGATAMMLSEFLQAIMSDD